MKILRKGTEKITCLHSVEHCHGGSYYSAKHLLMQSFGNSE